ncbi:MAG: ArsR family transcriptional regulator [Nanoarchaeota archaeon]
MFHMIRRRRITIMYEKRPHLDSLNEELQFFGSSLGLFNLRDKDSSLFRIFIELLKAAKLKHPLSSDELAFHLGLTRATVVHHLNKMMESGLAIAQENRYMLRASSLPLLLDDLQRDFEHASKELRKVAQEIEAELDGK